MPIPKEDIRSFNGMSDDEAVPDGEVHSPSHYTVGGYEAIDILKAKLTCEEYRGYLKGNILKYMMRSNYKGHHDQDCKKAAWYAKELESTLKHREVQNGTKGASKAGVPF